MEYKEKCLSDIQLKLADVIGTERLDEVMQAIGEAMSSYDVTLKPTALVKYDNSDELLFKKFFVGKSAQGLSGNSLKTYRLILQMFFDKMQKHVKDVTTDDVRIYLTDVRLRGKSANWANLVRRTLNSFYSFLIDDGELVFNPVKKFKMIKGVKKIENALTDDQMEMLRAAAGRTRDKAMIEFLFSTGCRVSEMIRLNREDIEYENGRAKVLGKGGKYRFVYLSSRCKILLEQYMMERDDTCEALFVTAIDDVRINKLFKSKGVQRIGGEAVRSRVKKIGKSVGIEGVHPHLFRKTMATTALKRGMSISDVQKLLGHESINTTTIYTQVNDDDVHRMHEKFII